MLVNTIVQTRIKFSQKFVYIFTVRSLTLEHLGHSSVQAKKSSLPCTYIILNKKEMQRSAHPDEIKIQDLHQTVR